MYYTLKLCKKNGEMNRKHVLKDQESIKVTQNIQILIRK